MTVICTSSRWSNSHERSVYYSRGRLYPRDSNQVSSTYYKRILFSVIILEQYWTCTVNASPPKLQIPMACLEISSLNTNITFIWLYKYNKHRIINIVIILVLFTCTIQGYLLVIQHGSNVHLYNQERGGPDDLTSVVLYMYNTGIFTGDPAWQ